MAAYYNLVSSSILVLLLLMAEKLEGQQSYVNNTQLSCGQNPTTSLGFVCNAPAAYCPSYITFRSTPTYNNPVTIAYLLAADSSQISAFNNNVSDVDPLPNDTLIVVPVNCTCSNRDAAGGNYYQHNASYVLKHQGETYFSVANDTYQALTTCQSMEAQNPYNLRLLVPNLNLTVPIRCACPTPNQITAGFNHLLTYLVRQGDSYDSIANAFSGAGATIQGILDANELSTSNLIYFFTPLLVPLTREPTRENINTAALPPLPPNSPPNQSTVPTNQSSSRTRVFIGVGVAAAILLLLLFSGFLIWFLFRHQRHKSEIEEEDEEGYSPVAAVAVKEEAPFAMSSDSIRRSIIESLTVYRFEDLEKATESFAEANRMSGSVYRGSFKGDDAAVKIMKGDVSREIGVLRQINHSHIIRLSGFCLHQGITYLVYEYAHNGSLNDSLRPSTISKKVANDDDNKYNSSRPITSLDWKQRVQIAYDVADALNYLHNFTRPPYVHKNLTSSNVLLDSNTRAKVANFGLARSLVDTNNDDDDNHHHQTAVTRHVVGTYGYMAPEYIENGVVTPKLDIFALGVVMLELLSGKEPIINVDEVKVDQLLLSEIIQVVMGGENVREKLQQFMDPCLGKEYPLDVAYSMAELARSCVAHNLNARPAVLEVVMALSKLLSSSLDWDPSHELENSNSFSLSD